MTISLGQRLDDSIELNGVTKRLDPVGAQYPLYITINHDGDSMLPRQLLVNSIDTAFATQLDTICRFINLHLSQLPLSNKDEQEYYREQVEMVVINLKQTFDPNGGYFVPQKGHVPSVIAHLGYLIEDYMADIALQPKAA